MRVFLFCIAATSVFAQLSSDQKSIDFQNLAAVYDKNYAPYEWKRDTQGFDLLDLTKWLNRAQATKNDLEFYDLMSEYVASLNDAHSVYVVPSSYSVRLGFTGDIYDGKVLIDSIDRTLLAAGKYPFQIGDELVSVDGRGVEDLIIGFSRYGIAANPSSTRRNAVSRILTRSQSRIARVVELGDTAAVQIRRQSGDLESYTIQWTKSGLPLLSVGPVPVPKAAAQRAALEDADYMAPLRRLQNIALPDPSTVLNNGATAPVFAMPAGFVQRLGRGAADEFFSGTFESGGFKIGFIRIPSFIPRSTANALTQFSSEIAYFQANTDGLVIDDMRNPGGSVSYCNALLQWLMPSRFRTIPFEVRANSTWVQSFSASLTSAQAQGAEKWIQDLLGDIYYSLVTANRENRGRTGPIPLDGVTIDRDPMTDGTGKILSYSKPIMVLVDEFSASGGDYFPATIQDNGRGLLFGMRTMGAGGSVSGYLAGIYSEGSTNVTESLMIRKNPIVSQEYPTAPYVENIGVRPEIVNDYMTKDNLLRNGRAFVDAFSAAIAAHIEKTR